MENRNYHTITDELKIASLKNVMDATVGVLPLLIHLPGHRDREYLEAYDSLMSSPRSSDSVEATLCSLVVREVDRILSQRTKILPFFSRPH